MEIVSKHQLENFLDPDRILDLIQLSIPSELNIYNQAHLEIDTPVTLVSKFHTKTLHEIGVSFTLDGEIKGNVICLLDTFDHEIKDSDSAFFNSLFIESMNILIGQLVTNMEDNFNLQSMLSTPSLLQKSDDHGIKTAEQFVSTNVGFKFITVNNEYDLRVVTQIAKSGGLR